MKGRKKIFYANRNKKAARVAILTSDKINSKTKTLTREKGGHYKVIKQSTQQKAITFVNIYAPNVGAPRYKKQILTDIKGETESNIIIVWNFNTPLKSKNRSSRWK